MAIFYRKNLSFALISDTVVSQVMKYPEGDETGRDLPGAVACRTATSLRHVNENES